MKDLDLKPFEVSWANSQSDEFNTLGKLNAVAFIGEHWPLLKAEIERLRTHRDRLTSELDEAKAAILAKDTKTDGTN